MNASSRELQPGDIQSIARWLAAAADLNETTLREALGKPDYLARVLTLDAGAPGGSDIAGFYLAQCVVEDCSLLDICVAPAQRRRGYGRKMLEDLYRQASQRHCSRILLEVRASNEPAIALYRGDGFEYQGSRPGYYPVTDQSAGLVGREDALLFCRSCPLAVTGGHPPSSQV